MSKNEVNVGLAVILTTVAETGYAPEGVMYAAMCDRYSLDQFKTLIGLLMEAGCLIQGLMHCVEITPKGRELAAKIEAFKAVAS